MKKNWLDISIVVALVLTLGPIVLVPFVRGAEAYKLLGLMVSFFAIVLSLLTYHKYKTFFKGQTKPLVIPKMYGIGISFNPNHPVGRVIWYTTIGLLISIFIWMVMTPAGNLN